MHLRTRYRPSFPPFAVVSVCVAALMAMLWGPLGDQLAQQAVYLPRMVVAASVVLPVAFLTWYLFSWSEVRGGRLTVRSMLSANSADLRSLTVVEVLAKPPGRFSVPGAGESRRRFELMLHLRDDAGRHVLLPLNAWRDEDLLMARILRATVECHVPIEGEPLLVKRFSALLATYRCWDRQQAAA